MLDNIRIVLIGTTHPGNIGSTARAMKNMGLNNLYLVAPEKFPHAKAYALASGANNVLDNATVVDDLDAAIADCGLVIGASARSRSLPWTVLNAEQCAEKAVSEAGQHPVAIIFGREHSGLTNEELQRCNFHVTIPCNPDYASLNLAQAVQVICYELRLASLADSTPEQEQIDSYATAEENEQFYQHLEKILIDLDFLKPSNPKQLMVRLRRLFSRVRLESNEMNIFRGILAAMEKRL